MRYCRIWLLKSVELDPVSVVSDVDELSEDEDNTEVVLLVSLELEVDSRLLSLLISVEISWLALLDDPMPLIDMDVSFKILHRRRRQARAMPEKIHSNYNGVGLTAGKY